MASSELFSYLNLPRNEFSLIRFKAFRSFPQFDSLAFRGFRRGYRRCGRRRGFVGWTRTEIVDASYSADGVDASQVGLGQGGDSERRRGRRSQSTLDLGSHRPFVRP